MDGPIVVTGAGGQLGSELCRQLAARAIGMDLPAFDLTDGERVLDMLGRASPSAVINAAAYTQVDRAEDEPELCRAINVTGVGHLVEACQKSGAVLVQVSTDYVFGGGPPRRTPYRETDPPSPQGVYAKTKLAGEEEASQMERHFVVRTCGLYGNPGPRCAGNFVRTMLRLGQERSELRIVRDQVCTPSYVPHVARAILFLLTTQSFGTYHVVNSGQSTWYDFAAEIFRLAGCQVKLEAISTEEFGPKAPRPPYSVLDTSKYHALSGRPEMPHWRDALEEFFEDEPRQR
jgi:dTDP-4-dehydrorhamnose reductase